MHAVGWPPNARDYGVLGSASETETEVYSAAIPTTGLALVVRVRIVSALTEPVSILAVSI